MKHANDEPNRARDEIEERAVDDYAREHPVDYAAARWHLRRLEGFSGGEEREFAAWRAASPAHEKAFREIERSHDELRRLPPQERARLRAMCAPPKADSAPPSRMPWRGFRGFSPARLAAALCVCAAFLVLGWQTLPSLARPDFAQRYASERGQQLRVSLPDGSALLLDSLTRAEVLFRRGQRQVRLMTGQILFTVAADAARPFDALAGSARVRVTGTQFSVRHLPGGALPGGVDVRVAEGRVRVFGGAAEAVELAAGQGIKLTPAGRPGPVARLAPENVAPWRDGRLSFDGALLSDALAEFERYGPTGLVIRDPRVARLRISGSFQIRRQSAFLAALPRLLPVRLERKNGVTEIVGSGGGGQESGIR
ncbi:MAG: FecR domain-containing protein [Azoarcus sp.]|jgi:transmembrane sensor|nr:FecR domain-containing protein [Azoarcus sp.]